MVAGLLFSACLTCAGVPRRANRTSDLSDLHGDLAFSLYCGLAAGRTDENVLFSPFAVSSALAFLSEGAGSLTRTEILSALGTGTEEEVRSAHAAQRDLAESLAGQEEELHLATGSSLHIEKTFGLSPEFQNHSKGHRNGAVRTTDFSNPRRAQEDINSFIEKETRGNITDFLQSLNSSAKSVLANYMYFKGRWAQPFKRRHTVNWRFQVNSSLAVEVPMMFRGDTEELRMLYDTNCSSTVVQLPYAGPLAMLLLLPKGEVDQLRPDGCLSFTRMKFWLTNLKPGRAEIRLPRFVLRQSYPLRSILEPSGIRTLFTDSVDLSGFSPHRKMGLQALHEAVLEVDETESENHGGKGATLDFSEPQRIIFDRPFMLVIYHEPTGTILLIGKITNPALN
ncbi:hypothetical protein AAFF_G00201430 [Aldrovandia affinis]|uniref:Serpin domain-containing protein n=1 Tax=Aldrovandia affinis TaxID=143900 RepID=A0AAD7SWP2_9TELE|nr:hypothetical protein AAFF_G00201430 [Aldrovandia affinis]